MNSSELKTVCDVLGSADFWSAQEAGAPVRNGQASAAWNEADQTVEACLKFLFLDHERFSMATQFRSRMKDLAEKLRRINEGRRQLSRKGQERSEVRRASSSLARQGWVDAPQKEPHGAEEPVWEVMSLNMGRSVKFLLESAIALEDPALALRVSSLWAFGRRRLSRRMAREHGLEVGQIRHWAGLLKDFVRTISEDASARGGEQPGSGAFVVGGFEDFASVDTKLGEQLVADEESLADLATTLEGSKRKLREELLGLLIRRQLSPDVIGDAAISNWGQEVLALRGALWQPLAGRPALEIRHGGAGLRQTGWGGPVRERSRPEISRSELRGWSFGGG